MNRNELKQKTIVRASNNPFAKKIIGAVHKQKMKPARNYLQSDGIRLCSEICYELGRNGVVTFPIAGSLLGLVRDGKFMTHDDDIDIGVVCNSNFQWDSVNQVFARLDCKMFREFGYDGVVTEKAFKAGCLGIDVFGLFEQGNNYRMFFYTYEQSSKDVVLQAKYLDIPSPNDLEEKSFQGYSIPIPDCAEAILETLYGTNWKTPDPTWTAGTFFQTLETDNCFWR